MSMHWMGATRHLCIWRRLHSIPNLRNLLIEHGADVNAQDESHRTPLHLASHKGERFIKRYRQATYDETAEIVRVLIRHGADLTARDKTQSTPLHLASSKGSGDTMKLLILNGADVNAQDERHSTPLHLTASSHFALKGNVVRLLLSHGANVSAKDDRDQTPFHIASSSGISEIAELLSGE
ncbi:putative ankyrin repeat protein [Lactarius hatsudake]|nr:putative ankyrin repeat protein [Lactarius hatsudake]